MENNCFMVFVYGTLKQGEPNNFLLNNSKNGVARFIGKARTQKKWPMVMKYPLYYPLLFHVENVGKHVFGEVYEVDEKMLAVMDNLERHPILYERMIEDVCLIDANSDEETACRTWIYFFKNYKLSFLNFPHLESYSCLKDFGSWPYYESDDDSGESTNVEEESTGLEQVSTDLKEESTDLEECKNSGATYS